MRCQCLLVDSEGWLLTTRAIYSTKEILQCSPFYSKFSRQFSTPCNIYDPFFRTSHTFNTKKFLHHLLTFCPYLPRGIFLYFIYFAQAIFLSPFFSLHPLTLHRLLRRIIIIIFFFLLPSELNSSRNSLFMLVTDCMCRMNVEEKIACKNWH